MRCPKCEYLAFEPEDRCRNCGYDFSLAENGPTRSREPDLKIRADDEPGPLADFSIRDAHPRDAEPQVAVARFTRTPASGADLPLFSGAESDPALVATPRPPLAVRRATPDPLRLRGRSVHRAVEEPALGLEPATPPADWRQGAVADPDRDEPDEIAEAALQPRPDEHRAPAAARLLGAAVDALLVIAVDAAVVYFTLAVSGLTLDQLERLPIVPMGGFFLVLNGGYVAAFTAVSGRTIGKMVAGTTVVRLDGGHVTFAQALLRTGGYLLSALPVGLGFLLGLVGARLSLHDRLAGTHVIRA
jgi:uncharacterized RDD family membrane protein YckC